jgi:hypothetical protein
VVLNIWLFGPLVESHYRIARSLRADWPDLLTLAIPCCQVGIDLVRVVVRFAAVRLVLWTGRR